MAKQANQKLKILYLAKYFMENTDEDNPVSMAQIIEELAKYGIKAERKSIYDDIESLNLFGMDICKTSGKYAGYYNLSTTFESAELKLLIDAVESARFITSKKTFDLITKIESLTNRQNAAKLRRQVYASNRVKTKNEQIFYNVDKIYKAISVNCKISFRYFDLTLNKEKKYRKDGALYVESPVSLIWDDENYYLIAYNNKHNTYLHYRVDRMDNITKLDELRVIPDDGFDPATYSRKVFSMYSGEETFVTLRFENSLINVVFDRFGTDITPHKDGENHFVIKTNISVSHQFFGWIASLGGRATIIAPESTKKEFVDMINNVVLSHQ